MDTVPLRKNKLVLLKMYFLRSVSYLALVNSAMLAFLMLSNLERYGIDINMRTWALPIAVIGITTLILFGWLEDKLGLWSEENRIITARNPQIAELNKKMDALLEKVERLEGNK